GDPVHVVAELRAGHFDVVPYLLGCLAHCASSFSVSIVRSGFGETSRILARPTKASAPAAIPHSTATISAAHPASITFASAYTRARLAKPRKSSAATPAPASIPAAFPALTPSSRNSALARFSSLLNRVCRSFIISLINSPSEASSRCCGALTREPVLCCGICGEAMSRPLCVLACVRGSPTAPRQRVRTPPGGAEGSAPVQGRNSRRPKAPLF